MEEIAQVYARSLFQVAKESGPPTLLETIHEQLNAFTDALEQNRQVAIFFFSPYFSTQEKKAGLERMVTGADPFFMNFLEALLERHRMPALFRIRAAFEQMWEDENRLLPVQVTSAVELDEETVNSIGRRIGEQTGRKIELSSEVDDGIIGGIVLRVGNVILDASIRNRLEQLRKQVAQAA
jgi:F-type H+-transporting ATPase subunit delta